jgi:hypothetical protein
MKKVYYLAFTALLLACSEAGHIEETNEGAEEVAPEEVEEEVMVEEEEDPIEIPHFGGTDSECFDAPSERFANWLATDSVWLVFPTVDVVYAYLITHADSLAPKEILETDPEWGPVVWQQSFSNGMTFKETSHPEAGSDYNLWTSCKDMDVLKKNIFPLIQREENQWNEDESSYGPDGAGCGYDFGYSEDSTVTVSWYCGC